MVAREWYWASCPNSIIFKNFTRKMKFDASVYDYLADSCLFY